MNSMVDVGKPYYGQLQKVQGSDSRNVDVTAEPAPPVNSLSIFLVTTAVTLHDLIRLSFSHKRNIMFVY